MSLQYKKLVVWQRADDLFIEVHRLAQRFDELTKRVAALLRGLIRSTRAKRSKAFHRSD